MAPPKSTSSSFATFLIIGPTCFFLGILFSLFPYDYHVLWATPRATSALSSADYFDILETHLKFIHASPPVIARIMHIAIATGLLGFLTKLYKPSESNMLFDGASLVLYMVGVMVYLSNTVKGLRIVTAGVYGVGEEPVGPDGQEVVGREDSLRVMAATNTILALVLVGVLVLQAGQWYAARKEETEMAEMERVERVEKEGKGGKAGREEGRKGRSGKKRQ
ncbi:Shr3 amino acid permease chaperone [Eremomyces bilateralis CBS 781.70]|uniref:Shr3 amino acid permease chaperone n=1 Tax=Eremomyces bilateralis CBS 781.70 TaxID=1392243 RepID=A0A6G1GCU4_9PEZI|nr:Shr3 amino acid permease chaperone [Eremomyces bilateralis CBS 781.70]KAF1815679.1 Shr3 amino acid permease chaperone [Eremomyces bilateralis CBS 781.70]